MNWTSVEDLIADIGLRSPSADIDALRREVQVRLARVHPDRSNGSFRNNQHEENYLLLVAARDFLDARIKGSQALIRVDHLPAIIEAVHRAQVAPVESRVAALRSEAKSDARTELHSRLILPRITSGTFAAIAGFAATFWKSFENDPVLGDIFGTPVFRVVMLVIALYAAMFFMMTWLKERRSEARLQVATSEQGRKVIFRSLVDRKSSSDEPSVFSLGEIIEEVFRFLGGRSHDSFHIGSSPMRHLLGGSASPSAAEKIARAHVLELEDRGVIHKVQAVGFDVKYRVNEAVLGELTPDWQRHNTPLRAEEGQDPAQLVRTKAQS